MHTVLRQVLHGITGYRVYIVNCSYNFMENVWFKDVLGMYTVLRQALHRGIIQVVETQFSSCLKYNMLFFCFIIYLYFLNLI